MNQDDLCILDAWVTYRSHPAWKVIIDKTARSLIRLQRGWEGIAFKNIASPSWDKSCLNLTCTQAQPSSPSHSRALLLSAVAKQTTLSAEQGCLNRAEGEPLQQNASRVMHQVDFCDLRKQRQRLSELVDFHLTLNWVILPHSSPLGGARHHLLGSLHAMLQDSSVESSHSLHLMLWPACWIFYLCGCLSKEPVSHHSQSCQPQLRGASHPKRWSLFLAAREWSTKPHCISSAGGERSITQEGW